MDNLSFAASIGASVLADKLESAKSSAREAAERAASVAAESAASVKAQAEAATLRAQQAAANAANMDLNSALELGQANAAALRESAMQSASALGNKVSSISVEDFRGLASPGVSAAVRPSANEDGSDSGCDDAPGASGAYGSLASRFGFAASKSPEKEGLLKQPGGGGGGGGAASSGGVAGSAASLAAGSFATLRSMSERSLSSGSGLAKSVGSSLGLVEEKPREPEGMLDRVCFSLCRCCPKLSRTQSLLGFFICFLFGAMLSLSALSSLPALLVGYPGPFAFKYTFGNLCARSPVAAAAPRARHPKPEAPAAHRRRTGGTLSPSRPTLRARVPGCRSARPPSWSARRSSAATCSSRSGAPPRCCT